LIIKQQMGLCTDFTQWCNLLHNITGKIRKGVRGSGLLSVIRRNTACSRNWNALIFVKFMALTEKSPLSKNRERS